MKHSILILSLMLAFALVMPSCTNNGTKTTEQVSTEKIAYACPMKCEGDKTYAQAGKCPKCGMDLEKQTVKTDAAKDK